MAAGAAAAAALEIPGVPEASESPEASKSPGAEVLRGEVVVVIVVALDGSANLGDSGSGVRNSCCCFLCQI